jgi:hypothetical protein
MVEANRAQFGQPDLRKTEPGTTRFDDLQIRAALTEGLREQAAPISRRLAEVKGLSNNAIRRLESIEQTIESERNARVDDLTVLVELLTEGWRAMNVRLERIEAALERQPSNVVPIRESA